VLSAEVLLDCERVVRPTPKLQIVDRGRPAARVGSTMMDLQAEGLTASLTTVVAIDAA
jgi:hypothetical protein